MVPALIRELDRTENDAALRALALALRGIADARAIPGLIRAIPRTLQPASNDYSILLEQDAELAQFLQLHQIERRTTNIATSSMFAYGRSFQEVMSALETLTGQSHDWSEYRWVYRAPDHEQQAIQRKQLVKHAAKWLSWWSENWNQFVTDPVVADIGETRQFLRRALPTIGRKSFREGSSVFSDKSDVKESETVVKHIQSSFLESPSEGFIDMDSGRRPMPNDDILQSGTGFEPSKESLAWAKQEGVDLILVKTREKEGNHVGFGLLPVDMEVWQIDGHRFDTMADDLRNGTLSEMASPYKGVVLRSSESDNAADTHAPVCFLFRTREGTCGVIQIQSISSSPHAGVGGYGGASSGTTIEVRYKTLYAGVSE